MSKQAQATKTLRASDSEGISMESDFMVMTRSLGKTMRIEMIGGTRRGAMINVWEPMEPRNLDHIQTPSDDRAWRKLGEVHFMMWSNAVEEWSALTTQSAVMGLLWRAG